MIKKEELPIYAHKDIIVDALKNNQVIVVESPTGSGKTTQIPKILYDYGFAENGKIGVTQPRRIAAISVSNFIAKQYNSTIPGIVGYKIRFVDETNEDTKIVIMTDGILLQELKNDPLLSMYRVIMIDEAHERSLNIDFIIGILKGILKKRKDLKVVISSATINARVFSEYFDECPVVTIEARMYPVHVIYDPPEPLYKFQSILNKIGEIVNKIDLEKNPGDVLIFLSGESQIKECISYLENMNKKRTMVLLPLYGRLSQEEQEMVFYDYPGKRKIIVTTNIAETSVTIDGVLYIIDHGYAKINYYNLNNFTSSLIEVPISKASCNQRKGRAGRTAPGICYRLYTEDDYESRELFTKEEIYRRDLSEVVLRMAELGIKEFEKFDFISHPGYKNIKGGVETLRILEAIDSNRELTDIGKMMIYFPISPRLSRMIVSSIIEYPDVLEEVLIAAAFLNGRAPFLLPHGLELEARKSHHFFRHKLGDFVSYLNIYRLFDKAIDKKDFCDRYFLDYKGMEEIYNVKHQLEEIVLEMGVSIRHQGDLSNYLCAVSKGLLQFVCRRTSKGSYKSLTAYGIKIHPGSVMYRQRPEYIVAGEIVKTSQMYARSVSPLKVEWLRRISLENFNTFINRQVKEKKKLPLSRDFTNFIRIGNERFEIIMDKKNGKVVILPYQKVKKAVSTPDFINPINYRGLKGKIIYKGSEVLSGMNLRHILEIVPILNIEEGILDKWPKNVKFYYIEDSYRIVKFIPHLLSLCKKKGIKNKLGFLTLLTDGNGYYWYNCYKDYVQALDESVSSLESIIDEDVNVLSGDQEKVVNEAYRKINELLEK